MVVYTVWWVHGSFTLCGWYMVVYTVWWVHGSFTLCGGYMVVLHCVVGTW